MEIALGVSMTPTTVRMVVMERETADSVIIDHDVSTSPRSTARRLRARLIKSSQRCWVSRKARSPLATIWCPPG